MGPVRTQLIFLLTLIVLELTYATSYGVQKRNRVDQGSASGPGGARDKSNGCWSVYVQCTDYFTQQYNIKQRDIYDLITGGLEYKKILNIIAQDGIDTLCQNIESGRNCYSLRSAETNCWIDSKITDPYELFDLQDYLCEDSVKNDLKQHWDCFFNPVVFERLKRCKMYFLNSTRACDPYPMELCIEEAIDSSPQCQPRARKVASRVTTRTLFILNHCSVKNSACNRALSACNIFPFQLYVRESPFDTARKSSGPEEFCSDLLRSGDCAKEVGKLETCEYVRSPFHMRLFNNIVSLPEYICVEERAGLEEHWDCFRDLQAQAESMNCTRFIKSKNNCRMPYMTDCVRKTIKSNPTCKPGAESVIAGVYVKFLRFDHFCDNAY